MKEYKILITEPDGSYVWAENLVESWTLSGSYTDCTSELSVTIGRSPTVAGLIPVIEAGLGASVALYEDGVPIFEGWVRKRTGTRSAPRFTINCVDRGYNLKKCNYFGGFDNVTPEAATQAICARFGISCGTLAATGVPITRKFLGVSAYRCIMTMYTLAAATTGEKYYAYFDGETFCVAKYAAPLASDILQAGSNLWDMKVTEQAGDCNSVAVYDDECNLVYSESDSRRVGLYGLLEQAIKSSDEDYMTTLREELEDGDDTQTITATVVGNTRYRYGGTVYLRAPETNLVGVFWILQDRHTCKKGRLETELTLNFKALMDEQEAGSDGK